MSLVQAALSPTAPSSSGVSTGSPHAPTTTDVQSLTTTTAPDPSNIPVRTRRRKVKQPKDSKVYKVAIAYVAMKAQGMKLADIAEHLDIPKDTISTYVKRAHKRGWLNRSSFDDPEDQIDVVLRSATVRNVSEFLDERDKDVTIEAAKGLGIFKNHQAVKVDGVVGVGFALKVQVELPKGIESRSPVTVRAGTIGGTPAMEGEVLGESE